MMDKFCLLNSIIDIVQIAQRRNEEKQATMRLSQAREISKETESRQFELFKQLHEQFAVNDNNKISNVITFLAAIFSVLIGYGYTFFHQDQMSLVVATIASHLILFFLCLICLFFGYSTRRDEFITYKIRKKYGIKLPYTDPFDRAKKSHFWNFLPDYYALICYACIVFIFAISAISYLALDHSFFKVPFNLIGLALVELFVFVSLIYRAMNFYHDKYTSFAARTRSLFDK